jgi:hypothetical protein
VSRENEYPQSVLARGEPFAGAESGSSGAISVAAARLHCTLAARLSAPAAASWEPRHGYSCRTLSSAHALAAIRQPLGRLREHPPADVRGERSKRLDDDDERADRWILEPAFDALGLGRLLIRVLHMGSPTLAASSS